MPFPFARLVLLLILLSPTRDAGATDKVGTRSEVEKLRELFEHAVADRWVNVVDSGLQNSWGRVFQSALKKYVEKIPQSDPEIARMEEGYEHATPASNSVPATLWDADRKKIGATCPKGTVFKAKSIEPHGSAAPEDGQLAGRLWCEDAIGPKVPSGIFVEWRRGYDGEKGYFREQGRMEHDQPRGAWLTEWIPLVTPEKRRKVKQGNYAYSPTSVGGRERSGQWKFWDRNGVETRETFEAQGGD